MSVDQIIATLAGPGFIALVIWFFWLGKRMGVRALASSGIQEAIATVKGCYSPDRVMVEHGKPGRLSFHREEMASCSEMVMPPDLGRREEDEGQVGPRRARDGAEWSLGHP